jgi:hypothetical protein
MKYLKRFESHGVPKHGSVDYHNELHDNITSIITNKDLDNKQICDELNNFLEQYLNSDSRGTVRTILMTLKPVRKIEGFDVIYDKFYKRFRELGGTN